MIDIAEIAQATGAAAASFESNPHGAQLLVQLLIQLVVIWAVVMVARVLSGLAKCWIRHRAPQRSRQPRQRRRAPAEQSDARHPPPPG